MSIDIIKLFLDRNHGSVLKKYLDKFDRAMLIIACTGGLTQSLTKRKLHIREHPIGPVVKYSIRESILVWLQLCGMKPIDHSLVWCSKHWLYGPNQFARYLIRNEYTVLFRYTIEMNIVELNTESEKESNVLLIYDAITTGNVDMIKLLWEFGIYCPHKWRFDDVSGGCCAYAAVKSGHSELADRLCWRSLERFSDAVNKKPSWLSVNDIAVQHNIDMSNIHAAVGEPAVVGDDLVAPRDMLSYSGLLSEVLYRKYSTGSGGRTPYYPISDKISGWAASGDLKSLMRAYTEAGDNFHDISLHDAARNGRVEVISWAYENGILSNPHVIRDLIAISAEYSHINILKYFLSVGIVKNAWLESIFIAVIDSYNRSNMLGPCSCYKCGNMYGGNNAYGNNAYSVSNNVVDSSNNNLPILPINYTYMRGEIMSRNINIDGESLLLHALGTNIIELVDDIFNTFCAGSIRVHIIRIETLSTDMIQWVHDHYEMFSRIGSTYIRVSHVKGATGRYRVAEKLYALGYQLCRDELYGIMRHNDIELCKWLQSKGLLDTMCLKDLTWIWDKVNCNGKYELLIRNWFASYMELRWHEYN